MVQTSFVYKLYNEIYRINIPLNFISNNYTNELELNKYLEEEEEEQEELIDGLYFIFLHYFINIK